MKTTYFIRWGMGILIAAGFLAAGTAGAGEPETGRMGWWKRHFGRLTWEEVLAICETPHDLVRRTGRQIKWRDDVVDEWPSGREVLTRGYGDCEDYARVILDLCREKGISASLKVFYSKDSHVAHAVVLGQWRGKLWMCSNGFYYGLNDLDDAREVVSGPLMCRARDVQLLPDREVAAMAATAVDLRPLHRMAVASTAALPGPVR